MVLIFHQNDNYDTPPSAWEAIAAYLPADKSKVIWEPFYSATSKSPDTLRKLGYTVIANNEDFFQANHGDVVVSNPPFSRKAEVLQRLLRLDKPFVLLMPSQVMHTRYFSLLTRNVLQHCQFIIPQTRIHFCAQDGKNTVLKKTSFDCTYFCYKMALPDRVVFLANPPV